jgi:divalent metal cation (Fe/Co/Zn/Cd) transporter
MLKAIRGSRLVIRQIKAVDSQSWRAQSHSAYRLSSLRCLNSYIDEGKEKRAKHEENAANAQNMALKATTFGAGVNLVLFVSKGVTGYMVNSTALMADAFGSLGDLCTDAIVYYAVQQARRAASPEQPWGRGKLEPIGAFVVSGVLGLTGLGIGYAAIGKVWQSLLSSKEFVGLIPYKLATMLGINDVMAIEPVLGAANELVVGALAVSAFSMVIKECLYRYTV